MSFDRHLSLLPDASEDAGQKNSGKRLEVSLPKHGRGRGQGIDEDPILGGAGWIYFVRGIFPSGETGPTKIGHTRQSDIGKRFNTMCTGSPVPLLLYRKILTFQTTHAEAMLHDRYFPKLSHGEWFHLTDEDVRQSLDDIIAMNRRFAARHGFDIESMPYLWWQV